MAPRGVQGYGLPVDRRTGSAPVKTTSSNKKTEPDGYDYSGDPVAAATAAYEAILKRGGFNPTPRLGAGGNGPDASDVLARDKFNYDRSQDAATAQKQNDVLASYQQMLSGGGFRSGQDKLIDMFRTQAGASRKGVEGLYSQAMGNIGAGYDDAQRLTDSGYGALQQFLNQNPNNPYANVAVGAGPTQDDLAGLLGAYGVSADPVRAQVAAEGAAAQQGAAGFQNLLNVLGASAQQSDASRLAEMLMSQNYANTSLGSQRAGFTSQAGRAQQDALSQIQAQLAQDEMGQESAATARRQEIEDAIAASGGKVPKTEDTKKEDTKTEDTKTEETKKQKPIDVLKDRIETANPTLKKKIEAFVKANPNAGIAKITVAFPNIAKTITKPKTGSSGSSEQAQYE